MSEISESPRAQAWREFASEVCPACASPKRKANGFCSKCYYSLPEDMKKALWRRFGSGYEEAHEDARDWLQAEQRAKS
jgi:hypothetical protein